MIFMLYISVRNHEQKKFKFRLPSPEKRILISNAVEVASQVKVFENIMRYNSMEFVSH